MNFCGLISKNSRSPVAVLPTRDRLAGLTGFVYFLISGLIAVSFASNPVLAKEAEPMASDAQVEARLVHIAEELRCLVCQNESLSSSRADLAEDLRAQVREQIVKGRTDQEIKDYLVERYGDFVLYRPAVKPMTWALWFGPFVCLLIGLGVLLFVINKRNKKIQSLQPATHATVVGAESNTNLTAPSQLSETAHPEHKE